MSKKRNKPRTPAALVSPKPSSTLSPEVEKLSDEDRWKWILRGEGGERTPIEFGVAALMALGTAALVAWAILAGEATVWHLALPLAAQFLTWVLLFPLAYGVLRHPDLRQDAVASLRMWVILPLVAIAVVMVRHIWNGKGGWLDQFGHDVQWFWHWVIDSKMHWPMLLAVASITNILATSIGNLYRNGPPFDGAPLGCAVKAVLMILAMFIVPFLMTTPVEAVWVMWGILLVADLLAVAAHWDIQRRLKRYEATAAAPNGES